MIPAYLENKFDQLKDLFPEIQKSLKAKFVTRKLLWEEYRWRPPHGYSYSPFCFPLSQVDNARKSSAILVHSPGDRLEIDFAGDALVLQSLNQLTSFERFPSVCPREGSCYRFIVSVYVLHQLLSQLFL